MDMNSSHRTELDKEDLKYLGGLGWLTALAFAAIVFIPEIL